MSLRHGRPKEALGSRRERPWAGLGLGTASGCSPSRGLLGWDRAGACGPGGAHVSDGLIAEATSWGEALKVTLRAEGGAVLLEEAAASQGRGTAITQEVLRVPRPP